MAIILSDNIKTNISLPTDSRYFNGLVPYSSISVANAAIASGVRYTGLTVNILGNEYWYKNDISDGCLIVKNLGSTLTGATNGLSISGTKVRFGGTLTGTTTINGAQTLNINQNILNLSGNTSVNIKGSEVTLQSTPPSGLITDSVIVWNSSDKQIKTVNGANLGDRNNVYNKTIVSAPTTGTTASTYVQLISGTTLFTLPNTPLTGQVIKIKDALGAALSAPIIINAGAGKTIDGLQCALINTNYGAFELIYGATNKWFSLAFIN